MCKNLAWVRRSRSPGTKKNKKMPSHPHWQCMVRRRVRCRPYTSLSSRRVHFVATGGDGSARWRRLACSFIGSCPCGHHYAGGKISACCLWPLVTGSHSQHLYWTKTYNLNLKGNWPLPCPLSRKWDGLQFTLIAVHRRTSPSSRCQMQPKYLSPDYSSNNILWLSTNCVILGTLGGICLRIFVAVSFTCNFCIFGDYLSENWGYCESISPNWSKKTHRVFVECSLSDLSIRCGSVHNHDVKFKRSWVARR